MSDGHGNYYGATDSGVIYKWDGLSVAPVHVFEPLKPDQKNFGGANPYGRPIFGTDGKLYGITVHGGSNGSGTVYSLDPVSKEFRVIYNFEPYTFLGDKGNAPLQTLFLASDGALYGTNEYGGPNGTGLVFKVGPTVTIFHEFGIYSAQANPRFSNADGSLSLSTLTEGTDGMLYGTTFPVAQMESARSFASPRMEPDSSRCTASLPATTPWDRLSPGNGTGPDARWLDGRNDVPRRSKPWRRVSPDAIACDSLRSDERARLSFGCRRDPFGYVFEAQGVQNVIFRATDGDVHNRWSTEQSTGDDDLTSLGSAPKTVGDPRAYVFSAQGIQNVVYRGADGHLHGLYWSTGAVGDDDLTKLSGAPGPLGNPFGYVIPFQGNQNVVYRGTDGHLHGLYWSTGAVGHDDLTALSHAPAHAGDPRAYVATTYGLQNVVYRGTDGHLHGGYTGRPARSATTTSPPCRTHRHRWVTPPLTSFPLTPRTT